MSGCGNMSAEASNEQRISYADIVSETIVVPFSGKRYNVEALITCMRGVVLQSSHIAMMLINAEEVAAYDHFRYVSKRCCQFKDSNEKLEEHIQVKLMIRIISLNLFDGCNSTVTSIENG
jgi:hypothetical protein